MNLITLEFLLFLIITVFVYYILPAKIKWVWLLLASIFFYLNLGVKPLAFVLFSAGTTYLAGILIKDYPTKKKLILVLSLIINVGLLLFLKYYNFGAKSAMTILSMFKANLQIPQLKLILPLGISFYTLQVVAYCVDVYKGKIQPERNLAKYVLFVMFFPHIVEGPIARFDQRAHQLIEPHKFDYNNVKFGMQLMLWGFFKKLVIADRVAILVNQVFDHYKDYKGFVILIAAVFYTIQIYADFSGYMDICRGVAEMFGIKIVNNFNHPYFATSIQDFWRRWHISLTSWLKDYIYIPLGGNRKGNFRKYINIMIVYLVSGFWHGVGLNYIFWGILHGAYQILGYLLKPLREKILDATKANRFAFSYKFGQCLITLVLVSFAWIFFRATNLGQANSMITSMFSNYNPWVFWNGSLLKLGLTTADFVVIALSVATILVVSTLQTKMSVRETLARQNLWFRWSIYLIAIFGVLILGIYGPGYNASQFIYMQF